MYVCAHTSKKINIHDLFLQNILSLEFLFLYFLKVSYLRWFSSLTASSSKVGNWPKCRLALLNICENCLLGVWWFINNVILLSSISLRSQISFHLPQSTVQHTTVSAHVYKVIDNTYEFGFFNVPLGSILMSAHTSLPWKHSFIPTPSVMYLKQSAFCWLRKWYRWSADMEYLVSYYSSIKLNSSHHGDHCHLFTEDYNCRVLCWTLKNAITWHELLHLFV